MAGIYLHIPFCKQQCSYCDFHFSTSLKHKEDLIKALLLEIEQKKELLTGQIETIYFGGGTPSILSYEELSFIVEALQNNFSIGPKIEFTLECNPDDITPAKLKELKRLGVNRLSIGVQSFFDEDLHFFNRAHNASQAETSILQSQELGFDNITVDLIYNTPTLNLEKWESNLNKIEELSIPHLSAYTLTVEPKTALFHQVNTNQIAMPSDEAAIEQFKLLMSKTKQMGMDQYEISNFGKPDYYSQHNSNYWKGVEYLGIGPSAHSYINGSRIWNVSNNIKYIKALNEKSTFSTKEVIDETTAYNEYILTRLRTKWGVDVSEVAERFNQELNTHFNKELEKYLKSSYLQVLNNKLILTQEGIFLADKISSDMFFIK
jgi:oxygen-independent coproporphyrinogen-3 oxidase